MTRAGDDVTREQRNTLTIGTETRRKCAVVVCQEPSRRAFRVTLTDATTGVTYEFCDGHGELFARGYPGSEVEPTWDFPPGAWLHDGTPLDPALGMATP